MPWKVPLFSETGELEWYEASETPPAKLGPCRNDNSEGRIPGYADGYPTMDRPDMEGRAFGSYYGFREP
jgi:hypothetical protein